MKKWIVTVCFLLCSVFAQNTLYVEAFDEQGNNLSQLTLRIRVANNSSDTLRNVHVRYFLPFNPLDTIEVAPYYLPGAVYSVDTVGQMLSLNIDIDELLPGYFPNSSGMSVGLNYVGYADLHKVEHYSYPGVGGFTRSENISVWLDDVLLVGIAPSGLNDIPLFKFTALRPESSGDYAAFVEITNKGKNIPGFVSLALLNLLFADGNRYAVDSNQVAKLRIANATIKVRLDSLIGDTLLNGKGELLLEYGDDVLDYVPWGSAGIHSDIATNYDLWDNAFDYVKTYDDESPAFESGYVKGGIFHRENIDLKSSMAWRIYSPYEENGRENHLPMPKPVSAVSGTREVVDSGEKLNFSWNPVYGAEKYRLTVLDSNRVQIHQGVYYANTVDLDLPLGKYFWMAEGANREKDFRDTVPYAAYSVIRKVAPAKDSVIVLLGVPSYRGEKDTRLLNLSWGEFIDIRRWDRPNFDAAFMDSARIYLAAKISDAARLDTIFAHRDSVLLHLRYLDSSDSLLWRRIHPDEDEGHRCWAIAIQELNHYYKDSNGVHGNLTQDEIVAAGHMHSDSLSKSPKGIALAAFPVAKGGDAVTEIPYTLHWALNIPEPVWDEDTTHLENSLKTALLGGHPVFVSQKNENGSGHAMIVDGFKYDYEGNIAYHFLNVDNYGVSKWRSYGDVQWRPIRRYAILPVSANPQMTNRLVHMDSDGDGVMDFDEYYRFHTELDNPDSDGDGIDDKTEIYSYTVREKSSVDRDVNSLINMPDLSFRIKSVEKEKYADIDKDVERAEKDDDSDNDGVRDGEEDLNHNGHVDYGETDPYFSEEKDWIWDEVPEEIGIYSLGYLRINDWAECKVSNGFCAVAAEEPSRTSVILGVKAKVSDIHAKGKVWLRNNAKANFIHYYGLPDYVFTTDLDKDAYANHEYNTYSYSWPWHVGISPLYGLSDITGDIVVHSGEIFILDSSHTTLNVLKVESGGTLRFSPGQYVIKNLQLDAGSTVSFAEADFTTLRVVEHLTWNSIIDRGPFPLTKIANYFKLVYYGSERLFIHGAWAGKLIAPYAPLIIGQASHKYYYGKFLGKGVAVHQFSTVYVPKSLEKTKGSKSVIVVRKEE